MENEHPEPTSAPGADDSDEVVLTRGMPAESTVVRGILHELAQTGAWTGLADATGKPVTLHVHDGGSGSSTLELRQPLSAEDDPATVREALTEALAELERLLVERTSDAS